MKIVIIAASLGGHTSCDLIKFFGTIFATFIMTTSVKLLVVGKSAGDTARTQVHILQRCLPLEDEQRHEPLQVASKYMPMESLIIGIYVVYFIRCRWIKQYIDL
jgi:hypothetical protein